MQKLIIKSIHEHGFGFAFTKDEHDQVFLPKKLLADFIYLDWLEPAVEVYAKIIPNYEDKLEGGCKFVCTYLSIDRFDPLVITSIRKALDEVMETISPTETPFLAIPNPLMKEHADPIDIMIENKSGSLNIDLLNKDHEMKQKIKQKHMMGILLHRHPCTSAQMAEKLAMHVDEARPLLEKLFKGGQIAVAKVYDKPSQKRASYRLWAAKSNDFKPAEVEQLL